MEFDEIFISKSHSYVLLGRFTTDPLKRAFGKLTQGSGGTYFINIQQVLEKSNICKAKLILRCDIDLSTFVAQDGHFDEKCFYSLSEEQCKVFDSLSQLEETLPYDVSQHWFAGYVTRKDESNANDTYNYVEPFGRFLVRIEVV